MAHPLVRTQPANGRRAHFLGEGIEVELVGDVVYWDKQITLHGRTEFDPAQRRGLKRISLSGSTPF